MPSSEDIIEAHAQVRMAAVQALESEGHPKHSAEVIVHHMSYDEQVKKAEKILGPIYRGAYSPY